MKDLTGKLGKLIFPDVEEKKSRRIVVQVIIGLYIALLSMAGMLFYSHQELEQWQKFQQIKGGEVILPEIPSDMPPDMAGEKEAESVEESPEEENGNGVAAHLFWLQINLIDCHRINRYNDISIEKEKVPEHLFFCRDKCSGTIYKHGYYIKIRNRIQ